ncbi:hypothetical protein [Streptomyces hydrogenans]
MASRQILRDLAADVNEMGGVTQQIAREEEQRRALAHFFGGWGAAGGTSS